MTDTFADYQETNTTNPRGATRVFRSKGNAFGWLYRIGYLPDGDWYSSPPITQWSHHNTHRWCEVVELPTGTTEVTWAR